MSMKQKIGDTLELLKGNRKVQVIAGCIIFAFLFLAFNDSGPKRKKKKQKEAPTLGNVTQSEYSDDIIEAFKRNQRSQEEALAKLAQSQDLTQKKIAENEERVSMIIKKMLEKLDSQASAGDGTGRGVEYEPVQLPGLEQQPIDNQGLLQPTSLNPSVEFGEDSALEQIFPEAPLPIAPPAPPEPERIAFVGAGDSVRVKLLGGVNAPTDGSPYPVIFKLVGDVVGPDGTTLPLGEARLIAAAQGSLVDSRALYRLTRMSVRFPDGRRKVLGVDGWIVGEDGLRGMQGILVDPIGKALAGATFAGSIDGFGQAVAQSQTQVVRNSDTGLTETIVDGDVASFAAGRGISQAARLYTNILRNRLNKLEPVVKVYSGREATAVFSSSFSVPGLYEVLNEEEEFF